MIWEKSLTFEEYKKNTEQSFLRNIEYHKKSLDRDSKNNNDRWEWVEAALKAIDEVENKWNTKYIGGFAI